MRCIFALLCLFFYQNTLAISCCKQKVKCCHPSSIKRTSWWIDGWAATIFSGPLTSQTSSRIFNNADFGDSGIIALAVSKRLGSFLERRLDFELESQAVQHFGEQKHFELNPIALVARWKCFPWNKTLPTTMAIGDGLSIATRKPKLEVKRRGHHDSSKTLNYVMAEATFSLPTLCQWAFVLRYHHRSGLFGTFHGVHDASTVFAAGLKYWF